MWRGSQRASSGTRNKRMTSRTIRITKGVVPTVETHGRRDEADLEPHDHHDAEPDGIEAEPRDEWEQDGEQDDHHRQLLERVGDDEQEAEDQREERPRGQAEAGD